MPQLDWWTKRKLYRLAWYLLHEVDGIERHSLEHLKARTHTDRSYTDWAIDFRTCGATPGLDAHYLPPGNAYRMVPGAVKPEDRLFWRQVRQKRGLLEEGRRILQHVIVRGIERCDIFRDGVDRSSACRGRSEPL